MSRFLCTIPNIRQYTGSIEFLGQDKDRNHIILNHNTPDLIVIAEGANSKTRDKLGIESVPTSLSKLQIAGVLYLDSGGKMIKHWRNESGEVRLTGTMGTKNSGKTWIVADIDHEKITPDQKYTFDPQILKNKKRELINKEFRRLAKDALDLSEHVIHNLNIEGAVESQDIAPFHFQQKISNTATSGNNLILAGDSVGNNHWSVGGGMQIGAVSHNERLKVLIAKMKEIHVSNTTAIQLALNKYSEEVLDDTMAWGKTAMPDCYPKIDKRHAGDLYVSSIKNWRSKKAETPLHSINDSMFSKSTTQLFHAQHETSLEVVKDDISSNSPSKKK